MGKLINENWKPRTPSRSCLTAKTKTQPKEQRSPLHSLTPPRPERGKSVSTVSFPGARERGKKQGSLANPRLTRPKPLLPESNLLPSSPTRRTRQSKLPPRTKLSLAREVGTSGAGFKCALFNKTAREGLLAPSPRQGFLSFPEGNRIFERARHE